MATVMPSDIGDVTTFYLENFSKGTWDDAVRDYQHFIVADELFSKRREKGMPSEKMTFNLKIARTGNTVADSFFKADSLNRTDLGVKGTVKWHLQKTHFQADRREPAMMSGSAVQIIDYMKMQESDMLDGFFEQNEDWFWTLPTAPNDGTSGDPLPFGLPYWVVSSTTDDFGFNGGHPSGYSDVAGLSSTTYDKWKNGTFNYDSMSNDDFCRKLSEAMDKCRFKPPRPHSGENVPARPYSLYSSYKPYQDYQDLLYASNDDIGTDMGKYRGGRPSNDKGYQYFRGVEWCWVPALSETGGVARDLNEPIYGVNWDTFKVKTYGDLFMDRSKPIELDEAHNVVVQWMDTGYQYCCTNRRLNFVGTSNTASSS